MDIRIVDFEHKYRFAFENLNKAWIEKHFILEPLDIEVLQHPEKNIISGGGQILVALLNNEPAGVVALRRLEEKVFELTKMAVDEKQRKAGIGKKLMEASIQKAKELGMQKLILYSNTIHNAPAIALYRKMKFMEVDLGNTLYERGNIKMELQLTPFTDFQKIKLIEDYKNGADEIIKTVNGFPEEMLKWTPPSGKWSIHQNVVHLVDAEVTAYFRIRKFLAEPGQDISGFDEDTWVNTFASLQTIDESLKIISLLRKSTANILTNLPEPVWNHTLNHTAMGKMVFLDYMRYCENHTHIGQMKRVYKEWLKHKN